MSCRAHRPQAELIRLHRASDGSVLIDDPDRRGRSGRGAYLCPRTGCIKGVKAAQLARALRTRLEPGPQLSDELRVRSQRRLSDG